MHESEDEAWIFAPFFSLSNKSIAEVREEGSMKVLVS